jgi:hypothetical protein
MLTTIELRNVCRRKIGRGLCIPLSYSIRKGRLTLLVQQSNPVWFTKMLLRQTSLLHSSHEPRGMTKLCRNSVAAFAAHLWVRLDSAALDTIRLLCRHPLCYLCVLFSVNEVTWYLWNLVRKLCHWRTLECLVSNSQLWEHSEDAKFVYCELHWQ